MRDGGGEVKNYLNLHDLIYKHSLTVFFFLLWLFIATNLNLFSVYVSVYICCVCAFVSVLPSVELVGLTISVISEYFDIIEHCLYHFFINSLQLSFNLKNKFNQICCICEMQ